MDGRLIVPCSFAPLDGRYRGSPSGEYDQLIQLYDIPDDFVAERERSVTHSFGHQLGENGVESQSASLIYSEIMDVC